MSGAGVTESDMIRVRGLVKNYREGSTVTRALAGVSAVIARGEFVAVMGPSGSGKSTLLHILSFLDRPTAGSYEFLGRPMEALSDAELALIRNRDMGFVFQAFNLLGRASVYENVELPLLYDRTLPAAARWGRIAAAVAAVGLTAKLNAEAARLSGGEKQRVAIARALVNDPGVIFADEPTGNLDSAAGANVMGLLARLNADGRTVILVTHNPAVAAYARRLLQLKDGAMVGDGPMVPAAHNAHS